MPYPTPGESQKDYVSRFMGSSEAQGSFPKQKQRLAVAYSMYRQKHLANSVRHKHTPGNHNPSLLTQESAMHPPKVSANSTATAG
jgi:hypothetical protein